MLASLTELEEDWLEEPLPCVLSDLEEPLEEPEPVEEDPELPDVPPAEADGSSTAKTAMVKTETQKTAARRATMYFFAVVLIRKFLSIILSAVGSVLSSYHKTCERYS
jgi:hypothetical protein